MVQRDDPWGLLFFRRLFRNLRIGVGVRCLKPGGFVAIIIDWRMGSQTTVVVQFGGKISHYVRDDKYLQLSFRAYARNLFQLFNAHGSRTAPPPKRRTAEEVVKACGTTRFLKSHFGLQ